MPLNLAICLSTMTCRNHHVYAKASHIILFSRQSYSWLIDTENAFPMGQVQSQVDYGNEMFAN